MLVGSLCRSADRHLPKRFAISMSLSAKLRLNGKKRFPPSGQKVSVNLPGSTSAFASLRIRPVSIRYFSKLKRAPSARPQAAFTLSAQRSIFAFLLGAFLPLFAIDVPCFGEGEHLWHTVVNVSVGSEAN